MGVLDLVDMVFSGVHMTMSDAQKLMELIITMSKGKTDILDAMDGEVLFVGSSVLFVGSVVLLICWSLSWGKTSP